METLFLEIADGLRQGGHLDDKALVKIFRQHSKALGGARRFAKKELLPFYFAVKGADPERWEKWDISPALEQRLVETLRVKPRRTASGVATITVITKPWECSSDCLYCPNDLRMPKSYLSGEPACQRAERNCFDPYLQAASRLRALAQMGHATDKIELIVLGGTWSDYPIAYQQWFIAELFRALNDSAEDLEAGCAQREAAYRAGNISCREDELAAFTCGQQARIDAGLATYNQAVKALYRDSGPWKALAAKQAAPFGAVEGQHARNETALHRVVGLVIETRPDTITAENLTLLRRLGCTKIQIGIQSTDPAILKANRRSVSLQKIEAAFALLRAFGFKIHAHFMVNLYGSSPEQDKQDYRRLVTGRAYIPDEVKLYPCALVRGTGLCAHFAENAWKPYTEDELIDVLGADVLATPPFIRISRMIRDISSHDILVGNKKTNLRQLVERRLETAGSPIAEIRHREISTGATDMDSLALETVIYHTSTTEERFLQWVTPDNLIAGFLRLSLPQAEYLQSLFAPPVKPGEAMIREVHIYGKVARLHEGAGGAQHQGLGKRLIEAACGQARAQGYGKVNVISSVGTRAYYRAQGFCDNGLYQQKDISLPAPHGGPGRPGAALIGL